MKSVLCVIVTIVAMLTYVSSSAGELDQPVDGGKEALVPSWAGHYSKQSELCTNPNDGARCSAQFRDHLKIRKLTNRRYQVDLSSTQADQHVCSFSFVMDAQDNKLIYETDLGPVQIQRNLGSVEITSSGVDPTAGGLGICGAHADIDGLRFRLETRCHPDCDS